MPAPAPTAKDVHALTPGTCAYITLHGKRDFADVIKVPLKWADYVGLFGWVQPNHTGS